MKRMFLSFMVIFSLFIEVEFVEAKVNLPQEAKETLKNFVYYLNAENEEVYQYIDSSNKGLSSKIDDNLDQIQLQYFIKDANLIQENTYQVELSISASGYDNGFTWNVSGITVTVLLKEEQGGYLIKETDLFDKLGSDYIFSFVFKILILLGCIFLFVGLCITGIVLFTVKRNRRKMQMKANG